MKNLLIGIVVLFVMLFTTAVDAHSPQLLNHRGHGYGFYDVYNYHHLYPHKLSPGGTWYQPRRITPRLQPPQIQYIPGYHIKPYRQNVPQIRLYLPPIVIK